MANLEMDKLQNLRALDADEVIRVSIPAAAYFNLDKFQHIQKDILGRLGCPECTSGRNILYDIHRRFFVDEKLGITAVSLPSDPVPWLK